MNRAPSPVDSSPIHTRRLEQSLSCLAPGVVGAALLSVQLRIPGTVRRPLGEVEGRCGEVGNNFALQGLLHPSTSPSSSAKPCQANAVSSPQPQKVPKNEAQKRAGATQYKTGRSRPSGRTLRCGGRQGSRCARPLRGAHTTRVLDRHPRCGSWSIMRSRSASRFARRTAERERILHHG